jgi:two-component system, chemotaxis family, protein-glutamate methylesterase/glutaminase
VQFDEDAQEQVKAVREVEIMTGQHPIRVLVVDDSLVVRSVLTEILRCNAATELVGTAQSGEAALVKIPQLKPDVITLDIEMPGMNGLQTLAQIRKLYPKLPVIMFSTLTEHGASATLEALALGATDYAAKPTSSEGLPGAREQVQRELIAKILALRAPVLQSPHIPAHAFASRRPISRRIDIVAIGTSTGGPNALGEVILKLASDFPVPVVIVQHMPPLFTRLLAKHLSARASLMVQEGQSGTELNPGYVWIAPGDYHMTVLRDGNTIRLGLNQGAPEHSCRPAVDVLFRSVARTFGPHALGVVMTGMGSDGTLGAKAIHQAGGEIVIQDQATSVVWGMPGSVASAGLADHVYALGAIAPEIIRRVVARRPASGNAAKLQRPVSTSRPAP